MAARAARLIVLLALAAAPFASCGRVPAHDPATGSAPVARRIVSVVPAATEILLALGAAQQLAGVSSFDVLPPAAADLPRVGALLNPDTERILSLRPDLVVVYASQTDLQARLHGAGIPAYSYRHAGLADVFDTIHALAARAGREEDGERLTRRIRVRLDEIALRVRDRARPSALLVIDREPGSLRGMYVSGGRGFLHDMLTLAGGANVFGDVDRESLQPSIETILARAPEVVVEVRATGLISTGDEGRERDAWHAVSGVPAIRQGRVFVLAGPHLVVPGSRLADGVEALARALHPDAFP